MVDLCVCMMFDWSRGTLAAWLVRWSLAGDCHPLLCTSMTPRLRIGSSSLSQCCSLITEPVSLKSGETKEQIEWAVCFLHQAHFIIKISCLPAPVGLRICKPDSHWYRPQVEICLHATFRLILLRREKVRRLILPTSRASSVHGNERLR